jgi:hypothetical protein
LKESLITRLLAAFERHSISDSDRWLRVLELPWLVEDGTFQRNHEK